MTTIFDSSSHNLTFSTLALLMVTVASTNDEDHVAPPTNKCYHHEPVQLEGI